MDLGRWDWMAPNLRDGWSRLLQSQADMTLGDVQATKTCERHVKDM